MTPDMLVRDIRTSSGDWYVARVDPRDRTHLLAEMPAGARWVAVVITDALAQPFELLVISDARLPRAWRRWTETMTPESCAALAAIWLRCRHPHEWQASPHWDALVVLARDDTACRAGAFETA